MNRGRAILVGACAAAALAGAAPACSGPEPAAKQLTRDELLRPETCAPCHQEHVREWSGSMHAYAAEDPVFLAMNQRLQRETGGALGDFCVRCHAPMAVREGATRDGLDLAALPSHLKGVTCYFCHSVDRVEGTHNGAVGLASDDVLRGPFADPAAGATHRSAYSELHDRERLASSDLCGACHDIVTPAGAHIERTFEEWKGSVFKHALGATCGQCHMDGSSTPQPVAAPPTGETMPVRTRHAHTFAAVDVAITPFPEQDAQRAEIQRQLDFTLQSAVCVGTVGGSSTLRVILDNVGAGHSFPSGSAPDRRAWVELTAKRAGAVVFESGRVPAAEAVAEHPDPNLWLLRDCVFDGAGQETHLFGLAASYESHLLPTQASFDPRDPAYYRNNIVRAFPQDGTLLPAVVDEVEMKVLLEPIGREVLADLARSGDLDPAFVDAMPTFQVGATTVWRRGDAKPGFVEGPVQFTCASTSPSFAFGADRYPAAASVRCR